ncbi:hypothetical protein BT96DRAFT_924596 [Gymnopus androsaceus JB14]|uniref:RING-type domain-containing protein n=1 Tax=Gymnopus androsaceus JB14 TaxID=1447944 RepID=A0A6A4H5J1_9AGAR|nr:hypothetical protein BT96DRAFT_924596 [Gymnopus androsaceus JB14]
MSSRPGSSEVLGTSVSTRKRPGSDDLCDTDGPSLKKLKSEPESSNPKKDKKKRKKKKKKVSVVTAVAPILKRTVTSRPSASRAPADEIEGKMGQQPPPEASVEVPAQVVPEPDSDTSVAVIEKLNAELATKSTASPYCLDLLYKPFALAPCGHIACYSCLMSWFSRPTEDGAGPSARQPPIWIRRKTCPHCRATVREPPVEVWAIKNMVTSLVGTGLLVGIPPPPEPETAETGETANKDELWKNIFYPHRPRHQPSHLASPEDVGIRDEADGGVYRCTDCMHEIVNGVCTNCDRIYAGHPRDIDFSDDDEDMEVFYDIYDGGFDLDEEEAIQHDIGGVGWQIAHVARLFEGSEDEEDVYHLPDLDFIDDGDVDLGERAEDDAHGDVEVHELGLGHAQEPTEVIEVASEDEDDQPHIRAPRRGGNHAQRTINMLSEDEDDEDEEDIHAGIAYIDPPPTGRRRERIVIFDSEDDDEEDGDQWSSSLRDRRFLEISDAEEEEDRHGHEDMYFEADDDDLHHRDDYDEEDDYSYTDYY